ncbi:MAG: LD-carboxypeptidase [Bacteroidota bacterium]
MCWVVFDAEAVHFANPTDPGDRLARATDRTVTLTSGKARGRLIGGNLTVLSAMIDSDYLPDWSGHILFLEDIGEAVYRIDRMMTQLRLAGVLEQISGFVFGHCTDCDPDSGGYGSLTLDQVLDDHLKPYGIPAFRGAMIGHIADKFTVPVGVEAEMDADAGTITMLEAAVV